MIVPSGCRKQPFTMYPLQCTIGLINNETIAMSDEKATKRNAMLRAIYNRMPPSIGAMERYNIIAEITRSSQIAVRSWISQNDKRYIPQIKLEAVKAAYQKYGSTLQKKVGQQSVTP